MEFTNADNLMIHTHLYMHMHICFYSLSLTDVIGYEPGSQSSESPEIFHVFQQDREKRREIKCFI